MKWPTEVRRLLRVRVPLKMRPPFCLTALGSKNWTIAQAPLDAFHYVMTNAATLPFPPRMCFYTPLAKSAFALT